MSLIDAITEALTPHAKALGVVATHHASKITAELVEIRKGVSDLNRPDTGDKWERFSFTIPVTGSNVVGIESGPELRVPLNEMWLVQNIVLYNTNPLLNLTTLTLLNDNGQPVYAFTQGSSGFAVNDSIIVAGSIALMPGEHITASTGPSNAPGIPVLMMVQIIRMAAPTRPLTSQAQDRKSEMYTPGGGGQANTHDIGRDLIARTGVYVEEGSIITPAEGRQSSRDMNTVEPEAVAQRAIYLSTPDPTSV